jgi:hypothetical protein
MTDLAPAVYRIRCERGLWLAAVSASKDGPPFRFTNWTHESKTPRREDIKVDLVPDEDGAMRITGKNFAGVYLRILASMYIAAELVEVD